MKKLFTSILVIILVPFLFGNFQLVRADSLSSDICSVDYGQVPTMQSSAVKILDLCNLNYPKIEQFLNNSIPGIYKIVIMPETPKGVAAYSEGGIVYLNSHWTNSADGQRTLFHEMTHVIQNYPNYNTPWLIEGIATYMSYRLITPGFASCQGSFYTTGYACAAVFLKFIETNYDKDIVPKLDKSLREGTYSDSLFQAYTGKNLATLWYAYSGEITCGDEICNGNETCSTCSADCGSCSANTNNSGDNNSGDNTGKGLVPCGEAGNPCTFCDFFQLISNVLNFVFKIVIVVATLMLVVGGVYFFFAGANPGMLETGKKIITSTVWGLVIIFTAFLIVGVIMNAIGLAPWTADFYKDWMKGDFFQIPGC